MKLMLLLAHVSFIFGEISMSEVIDEYGPEYCHSLEAVYGKGMMSEGGTEGIDEMFEGLDIHGKKALDIGSGLGGVAYHLASKYAMEVTGLDINPWMIEKATRDAPEQVKDKLNFVLSTDNDHLPFEDNSFDIVYSKGALCHIEDKQALFKECHRILKPNGMLIIDDWLSPLRGKWGGYVQRMIELEGLSLYGETIDGYLKVLETAKFKDIQFTNVSKRYAHCNAQIVQDLKQPEKKTSFIQAFGQQLHQESIEGYGSIAKAMYQGELLVIYFIAHKN